MERHRIGDLLHQLGQLSSHDIDEILAEQRISRQRFGEIAVSLGFCQPEHIWTAWWSQLGGNGELVNLDQIGIDAQAVDCMPPELALGLRAMPVRVCENQLVVAVADPSRVSGVAELARRSRMDVKCVLAPHEQIERALYIYYAMPAHAAAV